MNDAPSAIAELYSPAEAEAILDVYLRDKSQGALPLIPMCFIDRSATVSASAKVWHYAVVLQDVTIGVECSIGARSEIGRGSTIGHHSRIGSGSFLPPHTTVGHHVFIGPNVTFTDDRLPRVPEPGDPPYTPAPPIIEDYAAIGAGAVILPGIRIGRGARVAAGAIVTKDVPANAMMRGLPAKFRTMPLEWQHADAARFMQDERDERNERKQAEG